jgi:transposase
MDDIGVKIRRELKIVPAQVKVVEHATHTYACKDCHKNGKPTPIAKAKSPSPLIAGSLASPSLVAHIAAQKYSNALPLYRLEKGFRSDGVSISRQNMSSWVIKSVYLYLAAIYELLIRFLLGESVIHIDETTIQVLNEPGRAAQTKSYEWVYRTSGCTEYKIVIYNYRETREGRHPEAFLKDFTGFAHTDGYQAYHNLSDNITVVGCWSHARRPWENLLKAMPEDKREGSDAEKGIAYINALFWWERRFKNLEPGERQRLRMEHSKPIADSYFTWVKSLNVLPKSPIGRAVGYSLSQRPYLENLYLDGRLELSNNRVERSVKPFVIGRKNWLFSNTPDGAYASSVMYSIIETAIENGLHPARYMEFLLESLLVSSTSNLETLLPWSDELPDYCHIRITDKKVKAIG